MQNVEIEVVWGRGHPSSPAMSPFNGAHMTSYSTFNRNYASTWFRSWVIASYLSKVADFNLLHLHLATPLWMTLFEFCGHLWCQKSRIPKQSRGTACRFDTIPAWDGQVGGWSGRRVAKFCQLKGFKCCHGNMAATTHLPVHERQCWGLSSPWSWKQVLDRRWTPADKTD